MPISNDNLDQILNKGKLSLKDSMFIIALELKQQRNDISYIKETIQRDDTRYSSISYVDSIVKGLDNRLKSFEEARKWLITIVAGVLIMAILGLVLVVKR